MSSFAYGVDLGGTAIKFGFFDQTGTLIHQWQTKTILDDNGAQILPQIARQILLDMGERQLSVSSVCGVGIGVPGPVINGVVNGCINLGWQRVAVETQLATLLGLPVKAGNDANVAALGEAFFGPLHCAYKMFAHYACKDTPLLPAQLGNQAGIVGAAKMVLPE